MIAPIGSVLRSVTKVKRGRQRAAAS